MIRIFFGLIALGLLSHDGYGQSKDPFKSYKTQEEYCRDQPKMPTCIKITPFDINSLGLYKPPIAGAPKTSGPARPAQPRQKPVELTSPAEVPLQDWRFSHLSPAILINVNIKSLLQSPIWKTLFSAWTAAGAVDMEKARLALSDIGQLLISISPNHTRNPSMLMLARGNVDSAFGALLKSGAGMQAKRLDAFTLLVGEPDSLAMASHKMQITAARSTGNSLQQTATLEGMKYDIWIGVDPRHLGNLGSALGGSSNQAQALGMLANLRGLSLGVYLRDKIRLEVGVDAPSPEIVERMLAAYRQMEARRSGKDPIEGQVWASVEGAKLRLIAIMEANQLKSGLGLDAATTQIIASQMGPLIQALAGLASAPRQPSADPSKAQPGTIVIQGLN
jgi:hypothetical protein